MNGIEDGLDIEAMREAAGALPTEEWRILRVADDRAWMVPGAILELAGPAGGCAPGPLLRELAEKGLMTARGDGRFEIAPAGVAALEYCLALDVLEGVP